MNEGHPVARDEPIRFAGHRQRLHNLLYPFRLHGPSSFGEKRKRPCTDGSRSLFRNGGSLTDWKTRIENQARPERPAPCKMSLGSLVSTLDHLEKGLLFYRASNRVYQIVSKSDTVRSRGYASPRSLVVRNAMGPGGRVAASLLDAYRVSPAPRHAARGPAPTRSVPHPRSPAIGPARDAGCGHR
jgi:hypothetical protein